MRSWDGGGMKRSKSGGFLCFFMGAMICFPSDFFACDPYPEAVSHAVSVWADLEIVSELLLKEVNLLDMRVDDHSVTAILCSVLGRCVVLNHIVQGAESWDHVIIDYDFWLHVQRKIDQQMRVVREKCSFVCVDQIEKELLLLGVLMQKLLAVQERQFVGEDVNNS
jgi:hypothetical protein